MKSTRMAAGTSLAALVVAAAAFACGGRTADLGTGPESSSGGGGSGGSSTNSCASVAQDGCL
jgi:hypothetical protein